MLRYKTIKLTACDCLACRHRIDEEFWTIIEYNYGVEYDLRGDD